MCMFLGRQSSRKKNKHHKILDLVCTRGSNRSKKRKKAAAAAVDKEINQWKALDKESPIRTPIPTALVLRLGEGPSMSW